MHRNEHQLGVPSPKHPKTNISPENRPSQKERIVFQPSIFRCKLLISGRVSIPSPPPSIHFSEILSKADLTHLPTWWVSQQPAVEGGWVSTPWDDGLWKPAWLVDLYCKCRYNIPVPWILSVWLKIEVAKNYQTSSFKTSIKVKENTYLSLASLISIFLSCSKCHHGAVPHPLFTLFQPVLISEVSYGIFHIEAKLASWWQPTLSNPKKTSKSLHLTQVSGSSTSNLNITWNRLLVDNDWAVLWQHARVCLIRLKKKQAEPNRE